MSRRLLVAILLLLACGLIAALVLYRASFRAVPGATRDVSVDAQVSGSVRPRRVPVPRRRLDTLRRPVGEAAPEGGSPPAEPDAIADEYILSFYSEGDRDAFVAVARRLGVDVLDSMPLGFSVRIRAGKDALARLRAEAPAALEFESNFVVRTPPLPIVDPRKPEAGYTMFGARVLEWLGVGDNRDWGRGIKVAVLDSGINPHPALAHAEVTSRDLVGGNGVDLAIDGAHGTAVASMIAGRSDAVRGIAPQAELLNVRVVSADGASDTFTVAKGIVEAVNAGAAIINCSLATRGDSFLLRAAVAYAAARGVAVVASAGNDASLGVSYPAAYPAVVAVAAVDGRGEHLYFSNRGEAVDIAAPGLGVNAAWTGENVALFSGTSAAAPLVSGALAAVLSQNPGMTAAQAVALLEDYSIDAEAPGTDEELGRGILNMQRVQQRNEPGIYDVRTGRPYVVPTGEGDDLRVWVYAQNIGTELLRDVTLSAEINGVSHSLRFSNVQVGQTVSHEFRLTREEVELAGELRIDAAADMDGAEDAYPPDNRRSLTIVPTE